MRRLQVSHEESGLRLDLFLARHLGLPRRRAQRLLEDQKVTVDGRPAAKGLTLHEGWTVQVEEHAKPGQELVHAYAGPPLEILAEGPGWVAVDKPAGMPVHPLREDEDNTALNFVAERYPAIVEVGEKGLRGGVVHRLDVDSSGILLFGTEERSWKHLRAAFSAHRTRKVYQALVHGRVPGDGKMELELRVAQHKPARVEARPAGEGASDSRLCATSYRVLEGFGRATLLELSPVSGFLHQIRASCAYLGHPLLGDEAYGVPLDAVPAPRHMLHATLLQLDEILVESALPPDFEALLDELTPIS